jgi:hypothetical protein
MDFARKAEQFLIESNRQREKTRVQRLKEYKHLKEIEAKLADERKRATQIKAGKAPVRAKLRTPPTRESRSDEKAAKTAGLKPRTAEKGLEVLNRAESGDTKAKEALEAIDRDELSIDRAYREVLGGRPAEA